MAQTQTISQKLYDLLVTRGFDPRTRDAKTGKDIAPSEARDIKFDYRGSSGKDYGTAVLVLSDDQELLLFFGDNMGKTMEDPDKEEWFDFLHQLGQFATRNGFNTFSPQNLNQLKHYTASMAAVHEGLFESYYGTRQVSYMGEPTQARLMIRHNRALGEGDARHRYIQALFIETQDLERFRLPFQSLAGGRAMLEHVRQGGRPYDIRGTHIAEMVQEAKLLSRFRRASQGRVLEGITQEIVEHADVYYQALRENLRVLATERGYQTYFEAWKPNEINASDSLVEDIREMFVQQTLDQRIAEALPLLARIQGTNMKEAEIFENWVNRINEGMTDLIDNPEAQRRLQELLSQKPLPVGADGINVIPELEEIIGYDVKGERENRALDDLKDRLLTLSRENSADADAAPVIEAWLEENGVDVDLDAQAQEPAPEPAPAAEPAPEPAAAPVAQTAAQPQQPMAEGAGSTKKYIGRETQDGVWRVFEIGRAVAVAGPFAGPEAATAWIKKQATAPRVDPDDFIYAPPMEEGMAETKVSKYADMGANEYTTHFLKNITTGEIVSPHRGKADAEDALVAAYRDDKVGDKFKIVRARKQGMAEASTKKNQSIEIMDMRNDSGYDVSIYVAYTGHNKRAWDAFLDALSSVRGRDEFSLNVPDRPSFIVKPSDEPAQISISNVPPSAVKAPGRYFVQLYKAVERKQGVAEGYWQDAIQDVEAARKARKGKPFEKNPLSHDERGVYIGDKDLAGNPVPTPKEKDMAENSRRYLDTSGYVLVNPKTGLRSQNYPMHGGAFPSIAAAKSYLTRMSGGRHSLDAFNFKIVSLDDYNRSQQAKKRTKQGMAEGVTSPEIKQAYDAIMKTPPRTPERRAAIREYQRLRAEALEKKRKGMAEGDNLATFSGPNEDSTAAMDHRGAVTDSFYEDLARIKALALSK